MSDTIHLVCPHCEGVNRVPGDRLAHRPNCGRCHKPLFSGHPTELTRAGLEKHLSKNDIPVLVDFWAPWCGPCKMMAPHFAEAADRLEPHVRLAKLNTEAEPDIGAQYGIRSIPTLVLFKNGREIARQSGAMGTADIVRWCLGQGG